jgi:hypothetical protein
MEIKFKPTTQEIKLAELKACYGDDWSIEVTSFLGPLIHYTARSKSGGTYRTNGRISREDIKLLNADRTARGLPEVHDVGGWK